MFVSTAVALLAIGSTSVSADNYVTYNLLKNDRAAVILSSHQPHLPKRRSYYLTSRTLSLHLWSGCDPFPTIKRLRENIEKVSDEQLQLGIDAFIMARDRHTRWTNMAPYGCFHATTGVTFTFIEGDPDITKKPTVAVTSTSTSSDIRPSSGRITPIFKLEMNCLQSMDCPLLNGSSRTSSYLVVVPMFFGGQRTALEYLTTIYGKFNRLPSDELYQFPVQILF
ncbi:hypothetical protein BASA83_013223 [Batrachochytrium salamandrivorans]|nr:hypothetical protein BASA83_013223 [Batrachochytrium salamandrivorans]